MPKGSSSRTGFGGYSFYVKNNKLCYVHNYCNVVDVSGERVVDEELEGRIAMAIQ